MNPTLRLLFAAWALALPAHPCAPTAPSLGVAQRDEDPLDRAAADATGVAGLIAVSRQAEAAGDKDRALLYAKLALGLADAREESAARARWLEVRAAVSAPDPDPTIALKAFAKDLMAIAEACGGGTRGLYANAADILNQLAGTAYAREAESKLAGLFKKDKAIALLLESGVPVIVTQRLKYNPKDVPRLDAAHSTWENAHLLKGENYRVKTNMGLETAWAMLDAMEQINRFYRKVFQHKERGKMSTCEVRVYKTRAEFDQYEDVEEDVLGFFRPDENNVTTYDHGTQPGFTRDELWSTLFHEASHQFTNAIWKLLVPTWLNEGTASYFEGALLQPGGFIATNRIPDDRLRDLVYYIGPGAKEGESATDEASLNGGPSLKDVIGHFQPGSYPGEYYPFGWGLVYFCRNYENERSERVYQPIYEDFMRSYTKGSGERNPFKRFEQFFVTDAKLPGVDSFAAFEQRWKAWIRALHRLQFGGPEQADVLIERGRLQLANGQAEYAVDSFRWATEKDPAHATAWLELGRAAARAKAGDAALYAFRRLSALALRRTDSAAALPHFDGTSEAAHATALAEIKKLEPSIERALREKLGSIVTTAMEAADAHVVAGFPITALNLLREADLLLDGEGRLRARIEGLVEACGCDGRIARPLRPSTDLADWIQEGDGWRADGQGGLVVDGEEEVHTLRLRELPPKVFRFEAKVKNTGALVGLLFDGQALDESYFLVGAGEMCAVVQYDSDIEAAIERGGSPFVTLANFKRAAPKSNVEAFTLAIDVVHSAIRVSIDGEVVGEVEVPCEELTGQIGLFVQGKRAEVTDLRLAY